MKITFFKKLFAHPVLLSLLALSVCAAGAGVGYATWAYTAVVVDPSANAYKNGTATAGAFNFAYDVAPEYPSEPAIDNVTNGNGAGGYTDAEGNLYTDYNFDATRSSASSSSYPNGSVAYIKTEYLPTTTVDLPSFVFPTMVTQANRRTTKVSGGTSLRYDYTVQGTTDHTSEAHTNPDSRIDIFPTSYSYIGDYSEAGLWGMTSVAFRDFTGYNAATSVEIGDYAFYDDFSLSYVTLPANLTSIRSYAFACSTYSAATVYDSNSTAYTYTATATLYLTYPSTKARWLNVSLGTNWKGSRSVVVRCSETDGSTSYVTY